MAVEVTARAVRALRLGRLGRARWLRACTEHPLPPGPILPSAGAPNIQDEATFTHLLAAALGPRRPRRVRLVLPARTVRLHALPMEPGGAGPPDLRRFLLWRLDSRLPFPPQEARLAYQTAPNGQPGRQIALVLATREPVLAQYERLFRGLGVSVAHLAPAAWQLFRLLAEGAGPPGPGVESFLAIELDEATVILSVGGVPHYVRTFLPIGLAPDPHSQREGEQRSTGFGPSAAYRGLAEELYETFDHAAETEGLAWPTRLVVGGPGAAMLAPGLEQALGIPCTAPAPPALGGRSLAPEAAAVLAAALSR